MVRGSDDLLFAEPGVGVENTRLLLPAAASFFHGNTLVIENLETRFKAKPHEARLRRQRLAVGRARLAAHDPIGRLLELHHKNSRPNGVRCAGGYQEAISRLNRNSFKTFEHFCDPLLADHCPPRGMAW